MAQPVVGATVVENEFVVESSDTPTTSGTVSIGSLWPQSKLASTRIPAPSVASRTTFHSDVGQSLEYLGVGADQVVVEEIDHFIAVVASDGAAHCPFSNAFGITSRRRPSDAM